MKVTLMTKTTLREIVLARPVSCNDMRSLYDIGDGKLLALSSSIVRGLPFDKASWERVVRHQVEVSNKLHELDIFTLRNELCCVRFSYQGRSYASLSYTMLSFHLFENNNIYCERNGKTPAFACRFLRKHDDVEDVEYWSSILIPLIQDSLRLCMSVSDHDVLYDSLSLVLVPLPELSYSQYCVRCLGYDFHPELLIEKLETDYRSQVLHFIVRTIVKAVSLLVDQLSTERYFDDLLEDSSRSTLSEFKREIVHHFTEVARLTYEQQYENSLSEYYNTQSEDDYSWKDMSYTLRCEETYP